MQGQSSIVYYFWIKIGLCFFFLLLACVHVKAVIHLATLKLTPRGIINNLFSVHWQIHRTIHSIYTLRIVFMFPILHISPFTLPQRGIVCIWWMLLWIRALGIAGCVCDPTVMREKEGQGRARRITRVTGCTIPTTESDSGHLSVDCVTLHKSLYFIGVEMLISMFLFNTNTFNSCHFILFLYFLKTWTHTSLNTFSTFLLLCRYCYKPKSSSISGSNFIVDVVMTVMK